MQTACKISAQAGTEISRAISRISAFLRLTRLPAGLPQVMRDLPREDGNRGEEALLDKDFDEFVGDAAALQKLLDQIPRVAVDSPAVPDRQVPVHLQLLAAAQLVPAGGRAAPRGTREIVRRAGTRRLEVPSEGVQNRGGVAAVAVAAGVARGKVETWKDVGLSSLWSTARFCASVSSSKGS